MLEKEKNKVLLLCLSQDSRGLRAGNMEGETGALFHNEAVSWQLLPKNIKLIMENACKKCDQSLKTAHSEAPNQELGKNF